MKKVILLCLVVSLTGCGKFDRMIAGWTGSGTESCIDGVVYLQFTSGAVVKVKPNGLPVTCE